MQMLKTKDQVMKDLLKVRRRKIIIQKRVIDRDEYKNEIETWIDWREVWAERNQLFGSEYYAAKQLGEEKTVKWTIRYAPFVEELNTIDYRIIYNNDIYDIKDFDFLKDDSIWFVIKAEKSGELDGESSNT